MSQPLEVDTAALAGVAREFAVFSDQLGRSLIHESGPPVDLSDPSKSLGFVLQPSGSWTF